MATAVTDILPYPPPRQREENTAWLGMVIFLGSWAMLFAGLFFAYGAVRIGVHRWPPPGLPRLPRLLPAVNTAVIALSSVALQMGYARLRERSSARLVATAFALGAIFLALQGLLWVQVWKSGLVPQAGPYPSVFWGLTAFHALHAFVGVVALGVLARRIARGIYSPARHLAVRLWAMYWHFVGVVWLVLFATVFAF